MTEIDSHFREALEHYVPLRVERRPDWANVIGRAQAHKNPRRARRVLVGAALAFALVIVASALAATGHNVFGTIGSWLNGKPGQPASSSEQAGFTNRNNASYAAFPSDTKIRRLTQTTVDGQTFTLLGFKSGESLCLRLVRARQTGARGTNQCVTLRELDASQSPVLVASQASFQTASEYVNGIFGFADDTVRSIEYRRGRGAWVKIGVTDNVFVALDGRQSGTVKHPNPLPSIVQVRAVTRSGKRISVPFVASDEASYPNGLPAVPSYLTHGNMKPQDLPGPAKVNAPFTGGTISWLVGHEPRGTAWQPQHLFMNIGTMVFSRAVQPDPDSPVRVGLFLVRTVASRFMPRLKPGTLVLCETVIRPLNGPSGGIGCNTQIAAGSLFNAGQPFSSNFMGPEQITEFAGAVADGVTSIKLYLASGRVIPAALPRQRLHRRRSDRSVPGEARRVRRQRSRRRSPGARRPGSGDPVPAALRLVGSAPAGNASLPATRPRIANRERGTDLRPQPRGGRSCPRQTRSRTDIVDRQRPSAAHAFLRRQAAR